MKKAIFRFFVLSFALCLILPLTSCAVLEKHKEKYTASTIDYFDTVITLIGYATSEEAFNEVKTKIFSMLSDYHTLFSIYDDGENNLKALNDQRTIKASAELIDFLSYAVEIYHATNGRTNIAMGAVLSLWHKAREHGTNDPVNAQLPKEEALREAAKHCDITSLVIDRDTRTVSLTDDKASIDVGAIGKGYAVEMIARSLEQEGISGYLINAGGNVRTVGTRGDGTPWRVGIDDPRNEEYLATLSLTGESLVTSGSYMRYYYVNGKAYHHIISPDTLMPSEGIVSLSVLGKSSAEADALSTALFTLSYEEGLSLLEGFPDVKVLWLLENGEVKTTDNFPN